MQWHGFWNGLVSWPLSFLAWLCVYLGFLWRFWYFIIGLDWNTKQHKNWLRKIPNLLGRAGTVLIANLSEISYLKHRSNNIFEWWLSLIKNMIFSDILKALRICSIHTRECLENTSSEIVIVSQDEISQ